MESLKISRLRDHLNDITDVTDLAKKMLVRDKSHIQNPPMLIYLMEGMKSTCDKVITVVMSGHEKGDKNNTSLMNMSSSTRIGREANSESKDQEIYDEFYERMNKSKTEIYNLSSKVRKLEEKSDQNGAIVQNLMLISQTINDNLVKIEAGNQKMMEDAPQVNHISGYRLTASKSIQTKIISKDSKGTSTLRVKTAFNSSNLRPKFVLSQYPKSQHFIDKLTVIAVKSINEYLIAQDSNGFGMMELDDVFSQTNGKANYLLLQAIR